MCARIYAGTLSRLVVIVGWAVVAVNAFSQQPSGPPKTTSRPATSASTVPKAQPTGTRPVVRTVPSFSFAGRPQNIERPQSPHTDPRPEIMPAQTAAAVSANVPMSHYRLEGVAVGEFPEYLAGATVAFRSLEYKKYDPQGGRIEITVKADGPLLLALFRGDDSSLLKKYDSELRSDMQMVEDGWAHVGRAVFVSVLSRAEPFELMYRFCRQGESFAIRTAYAQPPLVIVPSQKVPDLVEFEPDPRLPEAIQRKIVASKTAVLLQLGRIDDVERWMSGYLKAESQFPSGLSKLSAARDALVQRTGYPLSPAQARQYVRMTEQWIKRFPQSIAAKLTLAALYTEEARLPEEEYDEASAPRFEESVDADEGRRRALEMLYDLEQAGTRISDLYASLVSLGASTDWDVHLVEEYLDRMLDSGVWCPEAAAAAIDYCFTKTENEPVGAKGRRLLQLWDLVRQRTKDRYGAAFYAAVLRRPRTFRSDAIFTDLGLKWADLKPAFDELDRRLPNSDVNKQCYLRLACIAGDRPTAARLVQELGWFDYDEQERIWKDELESLSRRSWAAPDFQAGRQKGYFDHPGREIVAAQWGVESKRIFFCDLEGTLGYVDTASGERKLLTNLYHNRGIRISGAHAQTPDGKGLAFGLCCGGVYYVDDERRSMKILFTEERRIVSAIGISSDNRRLVCGNYAKHVILFDLSAEKITASQQRIVADLPDFPVLLEFIENDKKLLCCCDDGSVRIWNVEDMSEVSAWQAGPATFMRAAVSRDGTRLATVITGGILRVWSLPGGERLAQRSVPGGAEAVAFSPDNRWVATTGWRFQAGRDDAVHVWNLATSDHVELHGHRGTIHALRFSPDGKSLLSSSFDMSMRVWSTDFSAVAAPPSRSVLPQPSGTRRFVIGNGPLRPSGTRPAGTAPPPAKPSGTRPLPSPSPAPN
jgi:hypothetical protein